MLGLDRVLAPSGGGHFKTKRSAGPALGVGSSNALTAQGPQQYSASSYLVAGTLGRLSRSGAHAVPRGPALRLRPHSATLPRDGQPAVRPDLAHARATRAALTIYCGASAAGR